MIKITQEELVVKEMNNFTNSMLDQVGRYFEATEVEPAVQALCLDELGRSCMAMVFIMFGGKQADKREFLQAFARNLGRYLSDRTGIGLEFEVKFKDSH